MLKIAKRVEEAKNDFLDVQNSTIRSNLGFKERNILDFYNIAAFGLFGNTCPWEIFEIPYVKRYLWNRI